ncbi:MAG: hypothetical protein AAGJ84_02365 [Pseudomonadota bacterium]
MMTEEKIDLRWGKFTIQMISAIAMMIVGFIALALLESDEQWQKYTGASISVSIIAATAFIYRKVSRNPDEFERRVETLALSQAGFYVIVYIVIMSALSYLGATDTKPMTIFAAPGFLLLYRGLMAQYTRWYMAHGKSSELSKYI